MLGSALLIFVASHSVAGDVSPSIAPVQAVGVGAPVQAIGRAVRLCASSSRTPSLLVSKRLNPLSAHFVRIIIQREIVLRVRAQRRVSQSDSVSKPAQPSIAQSTILWMEKDALQCLPMRDIERIQVLQRNSIDLLTRAGQRLRMRLKRGCRALDFYSGFYMNTNEDGNLCKNRDTIHARSGAQCEIDQFHLLVPIRKKK